MPSGADNGFINQIRGRVGMHSEGHRFKSWSDDYLQQLRHAVAFNSAYK